MPTYKYYNVQLLPLDGPQTGAAGAEGYRRLLQALQTQAEALLRERALTVLGYSLRNNFWLAPFSVHLGQNYAYGSFLKFDEVESLRDVYTGEEVARVGPGRASRRVEIPFLFDYGHHVMIVARVKGVPSAKPLVAAMEHIFGKVTSQELPAYTVRAAELTSAESLDEVLTADQFLRVEVDLTFSNSAELDAALERDME